MNSYLPLARTSKSRHGVRCSPLLRSKSLTWVSLPGSSPAQPSTDGEGRPEGRPIVTSGCLRLAACSRDTGLFPEGGRFVGRFPGEAVACPAKVAEGSRGP